MFFLELSCFFDDSADFGNLISGSSAFSKTSLNIWRLMVHILLKPGLENFEHYFTSVWDECNCAVVWLGLPFFGIGMKTDLFQSCGHCWVFQICWHIECSTFIASSSSVTDKWWNNGLCLRTTSEVSFTFQGPCGVQLWLDYSNTTVLPDFLLYTVGFPYHFLLNAFCWYITGTRINVSASGLWSFM